MACAICSLSTRDWLRSLLFGNIAKNRYCPRRLPNSSLSGRALATICAGTRGEFRHDDEFLIFNAFAGQCPRQRQIGIRHGRHTVRIEID